ncbi:MAG: hypothetical protein COA78_15380 [Blastopirellula sp.]|nr:MAG: hypothetical protein COA78_15380 [Blastopirellula sp.]
MRVPKYRRQMPMNKGFVEGSTSKEYLTQWNPWINKLLRVDHFSINQKFDDQWLKLFTLISIGNHRFCSFRI